MDPESKTMVTDVSLNDGLFVVSSDRARNMLDLKNPDGFRRFRDFFTTKGLAASPELAALDQQVQAPKAVYAYAKRARWSTDISVFTDGGHTLHQGGAKKAMRIKSLETVNQLKVLKSHATNQISENIRMALVKTGASYPAIEQLP